MPHNTFVLSIHIIFINTFHGGIVTIPWGYREQRIGYNGWKFGCYKARSQPVIFVPIGYFTTIRLLLEDGLWDEYCARWDSRNWNCLSTGTLTNALGVQFSCLFWSVLCAQMLVLERGVNNVIGWNKTTGCMWTRVSDTNRSNHNVLPRGFRNSFFA